MGRSGAWLKYCAPTSSIGHSVSAWPVRNWQRVFWPRATVLEMTEPRGSTKPLARAGSSRLGCRRATIIEGTGERKLG